MEATTERAPFPEIQREKGRFVKGQSPGRPHGTPNKVNQSIREAFRDAFNQLGGADALAAWGRENPTPFYMLASKLIPQEITGPDGSQLLGVVVLPPLGGQMPIAPTPSERLASMERAQLTDGTDPIEP